MCLYFTEEENERPDCELGNLRCVFGSSVPLTERFTFQLSRDSSKSITWFKSSLVWMWNEIWRGDRSHKAPEADYRLYCFQKRNGTSERNRHSRKLMLLNPNNVSIGILYVRPTVEIIRELWINDKEGLAPLWEKKISLLVQVSSLIHTPTTFWGRLEAT